jgi:hypothetical protein
MVTPFATWIELFSDGRGRMSSPAPRRGIGIPHPHWIEAVVAVVVVVKVGVSLSNDAVLAHCGQNLAAFKVPKRVVFTEALPKKPKWGNCSNLNCGVIMRVCSKKERLPMLRTDDT